ncbi:MAG: cadherin-like beta sandwich domain-containing protein [Prolixibacteraceae bacterium]
MKKIFISLSIVWGVLFSPMNLFAQNLDDFSNLLNNPDFEFISEGVLNTGITRGIPYGWSVNGVLKLDGNGNQSYGIQNNDASNFNGTSLCWINSVSMPEEFELYQEVEGLPAGEYSVFCRLAVIDGAMTNQRLFANNNVQYFGAESDYDQNITSGENNTFANHTPMNSFALKEMAVKVVLAEGETLKMGIRSSNLASDGTRIIDNNAGWFKVDYFRLEPYKEVAGLLADLIVNGESISDFDPTVDYYEIEVPYGTTSLKLETVVAEVGSTVSIYGSSTAAYDNTTGLLTWEGDGDFVTIEVKSPGGIQMDYALDIFVEDGTSDSYLKNIELSSGLLEPEFHFLTEEYNVVVPKGTVKVEIIATPNYPGASVAGAGTIELTEDETKATIIVKSSDGSSESTYTINITEGVTYMPIELENPDFELGLEGELNDGTTVRGIPYGWSSEGELLGNSFGINNDGIDYNGSNLCWINSSPMPEEFELYQVVENLTEGEYILQCRLAVMTDRHTNQRLFANNSVQYFGNEEDYVANLTDGEENSFAGWTPSVGYNLQEMEVNIAIAEGESIRLGIRSGNLLSDGSRETSTNSGWFKVDHFRLLQVIDSVSSTSVTQLEEQKVTVFNTTEGICVNVRDTRIEAKVWIYTSMGKLIMQQKINDPKTVLKMKKAGLYIVKVVVNGKPTTQKIICR